MIARLYNAFRDYSLLSQVASVLFLAGSFLSIYFLFSLPHHLSQSPLFGSGVASLADPVVMRLAMVVVITILLGIAGVVSAMSDKREVVVFKDKSAHAAHHVNGTDLRADKSFDTQAILALLQDSTSSGETIQKVLNKICQALEAGQGAVYMIHEGEGKRLAQLDYGFAIAISEGNQVQYELGEGLIGQAAASGQMVYLDEVPEGYIQILSGLGSSSPRYLLIVPIKTEGKMLGVMELATFGPIAEYQRKAVLEVSEKLAAKI